MIVAVLGPTATGKSALALTLAERYNGEIINCDSTAVYRGLDIGTDKPSLEERRRVPHHLIDIVEPTDEYTAAQYARDASAAIGDIHARGRVPFVVGGTGFYFRALTRGLFPGPGRDAALRARLEAVAARRGVTCLHRMLARVDAASARRIQPRDQMRLVRALEVYFVTGRPLTEHFEATASPIEGIPVLAVGVQLDAARIAARVCTRVESQFARGLLDEVRALLAAKVPVNARALQGLVYRQVLEHLRGERDEDATRALITQENRRYARRQVTWFKKEPGVIWVPGPGESPDTQAAVSRLIDEQLTTRMSS